MNKKEPKCIFLDIDGSILYHIEDFSTIFEYEDKDLGLPGAREKLAEWHLQRCQIILTTGRPESLRSLTINQLHKAGMIYDRLIMGVGAGPRILINDYVEGTPPKAVAYNLKRNLGGISTINLETLPVE